VRAEVTSPGADVDPKVYDAKRISKLPGTWVRKGIETPERLYRMAKLLLVPEEIEVASWELLRDFAGISSQPVGTPPSNGAESSLKEPPAATPPREVNPWGLVVGAPESKAYAMAALEGELAKLGATATRRNDQLFESALKLGNFIGAGLLEENMVREALTRVASAIGLGTDGDPGEVFRAISHGIAAGRVRPREIPALGNGEHKSTGLAAGSAHVPGFIDFRSLALEELGVTGADSVRLESCSWAWSDRIAMGKINLLAGDASTGKSQLAIAVAAALTTGRPLPDGSAPGVTGTVLILACEDGHNDTIAPRLDAAGADRSYVKLIKPKTILKLMDGRTQIDPKSFQDLDYWEAIFQKTNPCMLIADPIPAFLGRGVNDHRNNDVRAILEPFADLLSKYQIAMLAISHFSKATDQRTHLNRILGSVAYANIAREIHVVGRDPKDRNRYLVFHIKSNLGPLRDPLAYRVVEEHVYDEGKPIRTSRLDFEIAPVTADVDSVLNAKSSKRGPDSAKAAANALWLLDQLKHRPQPVPVGELFDLAGDAGIVGRKTPEGKWSNIGAIYRAKEAIPQLGPPNDGWNIEETVMESRWGSAMAQPRKHWQACKKAQSEPVAPQPASPVQVRLFP
jgi:hypothetical protein